MKDYSAMLNLSYEIEGLITLQISRGETTATQIDSLIIDKISQLARLAGVSDVTSVPVDNDDVAIVNAVLTEEEEDAQPFTPDNEPGPTGHQPVTARSQPIRDLPTDPHISPNSRNEFADPDDAEATARLRPSVKPEPEPTWEEVETFDSPQISLDEKIARESAKNIHTAFSINDKFRFRRELFSNSIQDYNESIDIIAAMSSYDEAEDYFYNDLCWDPDNSEVKAFMEIVSRYFAK